MKSLNHFAGFVVNNTYAIKGGDTPTWGDPKKDGFKSQPASPQPAPAPKSDKCSTCVGSGPVIK